MAIKHKNEMSISDEENKQLANLKEAAKNGVPGAQYDLALLHLEGVKVYKDIDKDIDKAINLLKSASEEHANAAYKLGELYLEGEIIHKNIPNALAMLKNAAEKNHLEASYKLGTILKEGIVVDKNIKEAIRHLTEAVTKGHSGAMYSLAEIFLYDKNDFAKAQNYLISAYKKDHIDSTYLLGKLFSEGRFVKIDSKISIKYLSIASAAKHPDATYLLGIYYTKDSEKQPKDVDKGLKLLEEASNYGSVDAKYELAQLYLDPTFEKENRNLGKKWLEILSKDGYSKAQFMLSKIYFKETDFKSGFKWAEEAIKNNHPEAQLYLGKKILSNCEMDPQGINYLLSFFRDSKVYCNKGIDLISKSANTLKDPEAAIILAKVYASGMYKKHEVTQINEELENKHLEMAISGNLPEALYLSAKKTLEKTKTLSDKVKDEALNKLNFAIDKGNLDAEYYLATLNLDGVHLNKNENKAIEFLMKAAEKGHYDSQYKLGKIYSEQSPAINCKKSISWFLKSMNTAKLDAAQIIADRYDLDIKVVDEAALKRAHRKVNLKTHPDKISSYKNPDKLKEDHEKISKLYKSGYDSEIISSTLNYNLRDDVEYSIASMYHNGCIDLGVNLKKAKEWYDKGANNGHSASQYKAYALHKEGVIITNAKDTPDIEQADLDSSSDQNLVSQDNDIIDSSSKDINENYEL